MAWGSGCLLIVNNVVKNLMTFCVFRASRIFEVCKQSSHVNCLAACSHVHRIKGTKINYAFCCQLGIYTLANRDHKPFSSWVVCGPDWVGPHNSPTGAGATHDDPEVIGNPTIWLSGEGGEQGGKRRSGRGRERKNRRDQKAIRPNWGRENRGDQGAVRPHQGREEWRDQEVVCPNRGQKDQPPGSGMRQPDTLLEKGQG
ncbi:hypothetical protein NDU88_001922 [Pleurodeles waltl]|uniref:Uncharacterized protein n=1 Tax=Pleurodeles waltl TaxID=8319 RepID=A0AAV7M003_PLEWA|nr:hypothetical protein NDU88_001922 [Pleurodeles waltl]